MKFLFALEKGQTIIQSAAAAVCVAFDKEDKNNE